MQFAFCQSECRSIGLWVSFNASPIDYNCKLNYFAVTSADWKAVERGNKGNSIEQRQLQPHFSFLHTTKPQERCSSVKLNLWMRQTTCATFWGCQCECHAIFVFTQINWLISFIFLFFNNQWSHFCWTFSLASVFSNANWLAICTFVTVPFFIFSFLLTCVCLWLCRPFTPWLQSLMNAVVVLTCQLQSALLEKLYNFSCFSNWLNFAHALSKKRLIINN